MMPFAMVSPRILEPPAPLDLHAPDGFFSLPVALVMWAIAVAVMAISVRRVGSSFDERAVPLMGVTAAFIFAAQMINFPVLGGTSGHLLGAVLAAILLGPWAGTLVMADGFPRTTALITARGFTVRTVPLSELQKECLVGSRAATAQQLARERIGRVHLDLTLSKHRYEAWVVAIGSQAAYCQKPGSVSCQAAGGSPISSP